MHTNNDTNTTPSLFFKHQMRIHCHQRLSRDESADIRCDPFARRGER